jgi:hypothetical protein
MGRSHTMNTIQTAATRQLHHLASLAQDALDEKPSISILEWYLSTVAPVAYRKLQDEIEQGQYIESPIVALQKQLKDENVTGYSQALQIAKDHLGNNELPMHACRFVLVWKNKLMQRVRKELLGEDGRAIELINETSSSDKWMAYTLIMADVVARDAKIPSLYERLSHSTTNPNVVETLGSHIVKMLLRLPEPCVRLAWSAMHSRFQLRHSQQGQVLQPLYDLNDIFSAQQHANRQEYRQLMQVLRPQSPLPDASHRFTTNR